MLKRDLLDIAGEAAELLEKHGGLSACGRRKDGVTRVDFWTGKGDQLSLVLTEEMTDIEEIVAVCLKKANLTPKPPTNSVMH